MPAAANPEKSAAKKQKTVAKINHKDEYGLKTLYYAQKFNKEFLKSRKVQSYFN